MRIIHVLRKPLSEGTVAANTMKHGCGGLNIDASRIGSERIPINRLEVWSGFGQKERPAYVATTAKGRWPANVILQHLDGCRCDGFKRVKKGGGTGHASSNLPHKEGFLTGKVKGGFTTSHYGEDGKETVANWICEPGCPVVRLDGQSGVLPAEVAGLKSRVFGDGTIYGTNDKALQSNARGYDDKGGASRFFKQVGGGK
jgi:hypothetical protein